MSDFPQNLLDAIAIPDAPEEWPKDIVPVLYYIAYSYSPRDADVLFSVFRDNHTYKEAHEKYGLSRERCRQVIIGVLKFMRRPACVNLMRKGFNVDFEAATITLDSPIDDLFLSVRSYNCLKRAGVKTVKDILELGSEGLHRIRNLGERCYEEITSKVASKYAGV